MESLQKNFMDPPAIYRTAPLWVWNDLMNRKEISAQLEELKSHGFGGAFVHPRPGLVTEYLSDEWFELWGYALKTAKSLGLKLYIYDENSYPSGFAGGHVSSQLPDCLATGITYWIVDDPKEIAQKQIVKAYTCRKGKPLTILEDVTNIPLEQWTQLGNCFFVATLVPAVTNGWHGGFAYVNVLRPEVTKLFLETTHEQYHSRFGDEFGGAIPALFTDEPNIGRPNAPGCSAPVLPFSYWFVNEFAQRNRYSLLNNLPGLFLDATWDGMVVPAEKVRYDYYKTSHDLWVANSVEPIGNWCKEHNIAWTGHYLEHNWPLPYAGGSSPSIQSLYEYHQWPAIDMLLADCLRDEPTHLLAFTIQELRSAANQFGKERTLCELYGAGGWDSTFEDYKRMGDWILVNGVNFINQHLTYSTIVGARKRDHPQSFDWRNSWWDEYKTMNDYQGRASMILSQGKMQQRILVLNPSTTGYLVAYEEEKASLWRGFGDEANPNMNHFLALTQHLTDMQWDFDYGDEYTMARHAQIENGRLRLKEQSYDVVIISGDMKNMLCETTHLLEQLLRSGGTIIACGQPGPYVDGLVNNEAYATLGADWTMARDFSQLDQILRAQLPQRLRSTSPWPTGVSHMRRMLEDGRTVYFMVNHSMGRFETKLSLQGKNLCRWDLFSGETAAIACQEKEGWLTFDLALERNESLLLIVDSESCQPVATAKESAKTAIPLTHHGIRTQKDNIIPIGYCDLSLDGRKYEQINAHRGADMIFSERGFNGNPWDNKVQFRNQLMDRNHFAPGSGFSADYHFTIDRDYLPKRLQAVAEHPALCMLSINGNPVSWLSRPDELDSNFGTANIARYIHAGQNTITLTVPVFDVRMELESIYLRGDFAAVSQDGRWVLTGQKPLTYGPWMKQGYPFYQGAIVYDYTAKLDHIPSCAQLDVSQYGAATISVQVNGHDAGLLHVDGRKPLDILPWLIQGENRITLRVCATMKNLMGPHFFSQDIRGSAWPSMWRNAPTFNSPAPEEYDLMDMGIFAEPTLTIG